MTDIVTVPEAPVVPPFPALGSPNFNNEAYANGSAMPGVALRIHEIGESAHTNATAAQERAAAAAGSAGAAAGSAALATTNGAVQVALATTQSDLAMGYRNTAGLHATTATDKAALASADAAAALGYRNAAQTAAGTATDEADRARDEADRAEGYVAGISDGPVTSVNGQTGVVVLPPGVINIAYDSRAQLRTNNTGTHALVDGLGLFQHAAGSDEPDDDESCFATATGRWLLECPHWDVVADWQIPDNALRDAVGSILRERVVCPISSVATAAQASFTAFVPDAASGDAVLATPLTALDARLAVSARVTDENTVTVSLNNPSAAVTTAGGIPADWVITVFKEI